MEILQERSIIVRTPARSLIQAGPRTLTGTAPGSHAGRLTLSG